MLIIDTERPPWILTRYRYNRNLIKGLTRTVDDWDVGSNKTYGIPIVCPENNLPLSLPIGPGPDRGRGRQAPRVSVNPNTCLLASPKYLATPRPLNPDLHPMRLNNCNLFKTPAISHKRHKGQTCLLFCSKGIFSSRNLMAIFGRSVSDLIYAENSDNRSFFT